MEDGPKNIMTHNNCRTIWNTLPYNVQIETYPKWLLIDAKNTYVDGGLVHDGSSDPIGTYRFSTHSRFVPLAMVSNIQESRHKCKQRKSQPSTRATSKGKV
jgi:hypothetical protein